MRGAARRLRTPLVLALVGLSGLGSFAWYAVAGTSTTRPPRPIGLTTSTIETRETFPGRTSTSGLPPTTTPRAARPIRTCLDSKDDPGAARESPPEGAPSSITFRFSPRVASEALAEIARAASDARAAFGEAGALVVNVHCDMDEYAAATNTPVEELRKDIDEGRFAYIFRGAIWIYGPSLQQKSALVQRQVVYHEYFHAVQRFLSRSRSARTDLHNPLWLIEGSAKFFERAVEPQDLESFRRTGVRRWDALPALAALEDSGGSPATGGSGEAYTVGSVASDYLVAKYGQDRLQHEFWVALAQTDWRSAFLQVFGTPVDSFYAEFEAYRQTLRP